MDNTVELAIKRLAGECSKREHCSGDMIQKMRRWELTEEQQAQVMEYLTSNHYIDDSRYAGIYIRDKMNFNRWGPKKIEYSLREKHVDRSIIQSLMDEIEMEEWVEVAKPLIESKRKTISARTPYEARMKMMRFLAGRGFTMDIINECLE